MELHLSANVNQANGVGPCSAAHCCSACACGTLLCHNFAQGWLGLIAVLPALVVPYYATILLRAGSDWTYIQVMRINNDTGSGTVLNETIPDVRSTTIAWTCDSHVRTLARHTCELDKC